MTSAPSGADRRRALLAAKLGALVREHWPAADPHAVPFPAGAALLDDASKTLFVLVDAVTTERDPFDEPDDGDALPRLPRGWAGGALVAAQRSGAVALHVIADDLTPLDASLFVAVALDVTCWTTRGRALHAVTPAQAVGVPADDAAALRIDDPRVLPLVARLRASGCTVVDDFGIRAECRGLEVARVVLQDDEVQVQVGVGRHDRLAAAMLRPGDPWSALDDALASVTEHRTGTSAAHPANRLAPERWLRAVACTDPSLIGLPADRELLPLAGVRAPRLRHAAPACWTDATRRTVWAATTGLDLDAVLDAHLVRRRVALQARDAVHSDDAGHAAAVARDADDGQDADDAGATVDVALVLVTPEDRPVLRALCALVVPAADVVVVRADWRDVLAG